MPWVQGPENAHKVPEKQPTSDINMFCTVNTA